MKYRIHFEPKGAYWCIQFMRWELFWQSVKGYYRIPPHVQINEREPKEGEMTYGILKFDNIEEAETYVRERGIDKAYARRGDYHKDMESSEAKPGEPTIPDALIVRRLAQIIQQDRAAA